MAICNLCNNNIPDGAKYCSICNNWQSKWRRTMIFVAGISGGLTLAGATFTFIAANYEKAYENLFGSKQIDILSFNSAGSSRLFNTSNKVAWILQAEIVGDDLGTELKFSYGFNTIIAPNDFGEKKLLGDCGSTTIAHHQMLTDIDLSQPISDQLQSSYYCVEAVAASLQDPAYFQYSRFLGDDMVSIPAKITIHYKFVGEETTHEAIFDGRIYFGISIDEDHNIIYKDTADSAI